MKYRDKLESKQDKMAKTISKKALDGQSLDVVWNLTLATNIISANVQYGQIEKIEKIKGVDSVLIETQYEPCVVKESETTDPNMATSSSMIGSSVAWADGYTGAGSKVAIIDTGADTDHPSLNGAAYSYAVKGLGITPVTAADYADKLEKLNALKKNGDLKASDLYVSAKIPFGFNYIDADLGVTHDNDKQGDHGSHVTGIAAGNRYIEQADGSFAPALDTALTQGVAPDAQVYTMKVFGKGGGAYDSDYMAAIEDAMILGCDSANLSLGSGNPGYSRQSDAKYQAILEAVVNSGMVVAMSAGNSGHWFENTPYAYPYAESVSWATNGSPGSYTNSLGIASVDNVGSTGNYIEFAGTKMFYNDTSEAPIQPMTALAGEQRFVYVDAVGNPEDFAAAGDELKGAIAMCNRGEINFTAKGNNAVAAGAIGTIVVNNAAGTINMSTDGYTGTAPYVSLLMSDGQIIKANAEKKEANGVLCGQAHRGRQARRERSDRRLLHHERLLLLGHSRLPGAEARDHRSWRQYLLPAEWRRLPEYVRYLHGLSPGCRYGRCGGPVHPRQQADGEDRPHRPCSGSVPADVHRCPHVSGLRRGQVWLLFRYAAGRRPCQCGRCRFRRHLHQDG